MLETREQSAGLVGPFSGEINVSHNSPICLRFNGINLKKEDIFIKVSGDNAIIRGQEAKGYEVMELLVKEKYIYIKFRKIGGFKTGEVFVFGKCGNCFTREQRFFISGAKTTNKWDKMYHEYIDEKSNWIHSDGGENITIHQHKKIKSSHIYSTLSLIIKEAADQHWNKIFISDESHVWWNSESIITRSNVDIFRMKSDDILWKPSDINLTDFRSIRPIGKHSIIINNSKRVDFSIIEVLDI